MTFQTIIFKKEGHVATIILNRPERLNALNDQMFIELIAALEDLEQNEKIRVLVLTGSGRAFSAGADLTPDDSGEKVIQETNPEAIRQGLSSKPQKVIRALQRLPKPVIAMINGDAVAGGFDLALACDLRIASENARFAVSFTKIGILPGTGGLWLLPRIVGLTKAAELIFTGDFISAGEAKEMGILNKVVPLQDLEKETRILAEKIASNPPIALRLDKILLYKAIEVDLDTALDMVAVSEPICFASRDHKEAVSAFFQKRTPVFYGK